MKVVALRRRAVQFLNPRAPYNFDATLHKPSHFPSSDCLWEKGKYWITMRWRGVPLGLKFENRGTVNKPKIRLTVYSQRALNQRFCDDLIVEIAYRFNITTETAEFIKRFRKDRVLAPFILRWKGMVPVAANSLYETLVIYVVLQNATVRRTRQMLENLFARFGGRAKFDGKELSLFWVPQALARVPERTLRALKLGYRAKFLKRISEQFARDEIDEFALRHSSKEHVREEILKLYGIGPASVEYLLFEDFYHYDAFTTVPPWEQKILSRLLFKKRLVAPKRILAYADKKWGAWKKLAIHYIWEDIFWQRQQGRRIEWLEKEIRL